MNDKLTKAGLMLPADPKAHMQDLLYRHPLFEKMPFPGLSVPDFHVLVLGEGPEALAFLDTCLQAGQVPGARIFVTVAAEDPAAARQAWLAERPALPDFVDIDPEPDAVREDACGLVRFVPLPFFDADSPLTTAAAMQGLLSGSLREPFYQYVFFCLDTDERTRAAAESLLSDPARGFVVAAAFRGRPGKELPEEIRGVYLQGSPAVLAEDSRLFEMGFNTHLSYALSDNLDIEKERASYEDSYNKGASLSSVLSIPYKLWSLGIDCKDPAAAAAAFQEKMDADTDESLLRALGASEHRRWVLEKAAEGWTRPGFPDGDIDYERFLDLGDSKDKAAKEHLCLVPATSAMVLQESRYKEKGHALWNSGPEEAGLDPLDRISLRWHRAHVRRADLVRQLRPLDSAPIQTIEDLVSLGPVSSYLTAEDYEKSVELLISVKKPLPYQLADLEYKGQALLKKLSDMPASSRRVIESLQARILRRLTPKQTDSRKGGKKGAAAGLGAADLDLIRMDLRLIRRTIAEDTCQLREQQSAWQSFCDALRQILRGDTTFALDYDHYERILTESFASRTAYEQKTLADCLAQVRKTFYPLIGAALYRDFKMTDAELVRRIPFILTNRPVRTLVMPFFEGRRSPLGTDRLFLNLEASLLVHPGAVRFLYYFDNQSLVETWVDRVQSILTFMKKRHMRCRVSFTIVPSASSKTAVPRLEKWLFYLQDHGFLSSCRILEAAKDMPSAMDAFLEDLKSCRPDVFNFTGSLFNDAMQDTVFIRQLRETFPEIRFAQTDPLTGGFTEGSDPSFLYLKAGDRSFLRIREIMAMNHAGINLWQTPEFDREYKELWRIYNEDIPAWHTLCRRIAEQLRSRSEKRMENNNCRFTAIAEGARLAAEPCVYYLPYYACRTLMVMLGELRRMHAVGPDSRVVPLGGSVCRVEVWLPENANQQKMDSLFLDPTSLASIDNWTIFSYDNSVYITSAINDIEDLQVGNRDGALAVLLKKLADKNYLVSSGGDIVQNGRSSFYFPSPRFRRLFSQGGHVLELYVYYEALATGLFDEVATGLTFSWDDTVIGGGQETSSELDLIAVRGRTTLIVECKATERIDQAYYHRLDTLKRYGIHTRLALVHLNHSQDDKDIRFNKEARKRGDELGIRTFDRSDGLQNIGMLLADLADEEEPEEDE